MSSASSLTTTWIKTAIAAGLLTSAIYPLLIAVALPAPVQIILASLMGPLLSTASLGLYHFLKINRKTVTLQLAALANILAGAALTLMFLVQLAIRRTLPVFPHSFRESGEYALAQKVWQGLNSVHWGLDVTWDVYIGLGTFLFALNMLGHPRLGKILGGSGMLIAAVMLAFNLATFPTPPATAGLVDSGPLVGLWYLAVTLQVWRSFPWVRDVLTGTEEKS